MPFRSAFSKRITMNKRGIAVVQGDWEGVSRAAFDELLPQLQHVQDTFQIVRRFYHGLRCSETTFPVIPVIFRGDMVPWSAWFRENNVSFAFDLASHNWKLCDEDYAERLITESPGLEEFASVEQAQLIEEALYQELDDAFKHWTSDDEHDWNSQCPERDLMNPNPVVALGSRMIQTRNAGNFRIGFITAAVWT